MSSHANPRRLLAIFTLLGAFTQGTLGDTPTTTTANGASAVSATPAAPSAQLEVDFVFPRNETYKESAIFPVAFAFRGLDAMRTLPKLGLSWYIMPYTDGWIPGGIDVDSGTFEVPTEGDSFIAVANTNVSSWIYRARSDRYMMIWDAAWYDPDEYDRCGPPPGLTNRIMFSIRWQYDIDHPWWSGDNGTALDAKIPIDDCPVLSDIFDIQRNATDPDKCFMSLDARTTGKKADPCAAGIDKDAARSIESQAASMATASWLSEHPASTSSSTSSSNFAAFPTAPAGSTFVVGTLVTYLTFQL